jgi:hypothetical protein
LIPAYGFGASRLSVQLNVVRLYKVELRFVVGIIAKVYPKSRDYCRFATGTKITATCGRRIRPNRLRGGGTGKFLY